MTEHTHIIEPLRKFALETSALTPDPSNARTHDQRNLDAIAHSLRAFGQRTPLVCQRAPDTGALIVRKGNGTLAAAQALGWSHIAAVVVEEDAPSAIAYAIADNRTGDLSAWDDDVLGQLLDGLSIAGADELLEATGFEQGEVDALLLGAGASSVADESVYTHDIRPPVYEPRGDAPPPVPSLFDDSVTQELLREIRAQEMPADVRTFLEHAAHRHTRFNFAKIADFYAHADVQMQRLFERSALVIVDLDSAIEHGFVKLSERLVELAGIDAVPGEGAHHG